MNGRKKYAILKQIDIDHKEKIAQMIIRRFLSYHLLKNCLMLSDSVDRLSPSSFSSSLVGVGGASCPLWMRAMDVRLVRMISIIMVLQSQHTLIWGPRSKFLLGSVGADPDPMVWDLCKDVRLGGGSSRTCWVLRTEEGVWGTDPVLS